MKTLHKKLILAAAITSIMTGCSGGNSTAQNDAQTQAPAPVAAKTAIIAQGEIDSLGGVVVNGRQFNTEKATVMMDGVPASVEDLDVGMVVEVEGEENAEGQSEASTVRFFSKIAGTIQSVDVEARTIEMLETTVKIDADTQLGESIDEVTLAPLADGVSIRVSGAKNSDGVVVASRIDIVEYTQERISGVIESIDLDAGIVVIDGKQVDINVEGAVKGELTVGQKAFVVGNLDNDIIYAERIVALNKPVKDAEDDVKQVLEVAGEVVETEVDGETVLTVDGNVMTGLEDAEIENADLEEITNETVVVSGVLNEDGEFVVERVTVEMASTLREQGEVEAVDTINHQIVIDGNTYTLPSDADFVDSEMGDRTFANIKDINLGDKLVIDGFKDEEGNRVVKGVDRVVKGETFNGIARLHTAIASIDGNMLTTVEGDIVEFDERTHITASVDFDTLVLGAEGDKLSIHGIYGDNDVVKAKYITSLRATPTKDDMPTPEQEPEDKIEEINETVAEIEASMANAQSAKLSADKRAAFEAKIAERMAELADRMEDNQHIMTPEDAADMDDRVEMIGEEIEDDFRSDNREDVIKHLEGVRAQLLEAGNTKRAAHIDQLLANIANIEDMVDSKSEQEKEADDAFNADFEAAGAEIAAQLEALRARAEESRKKYLEENGLSEDDREERTFEPMPELTQEEIAEMLADHAKKEAKAEEKITALIAKIEADESLTAEQKAKQVEELEQTLASIKALGERMREGYSAEFPETAPAQ